MTRWFGSVQRPRQWNSCTYAGIQFRETLALDLKACMQTRGPAALEGATLTLAPKDITVGHDDCAFSAIEIIFPLFAMADRKDNLERWWLHRALVVMELGL